MENPNPTNIEKTVISLLYIEILLRWENGLQDRGFSIHTKGFNRYCKDNPIEIISRDSLDEMPDAFEKCSSILKTKKQNIFVFYNQHASRAKSLYFHLRNAIAHGHIERIKIDRAYYYHFEGIKGSAKQKERMKGQVKSSTLKDFVSAMQLTVKN